MQLLYTYLVEFGIPIAMYVHIYMCRRNKNCLQCKSNLHMCVYLYYADSLATHSSVAVFHCDYIACETAICLMHTYLSS